MKRYRRNCPAQKDPLRIAQGNVGKTAPAHSAFLQFCWEDQIDIILVQEPWAQRSGKKFFTSHPGYKAFLPIDDWTDQETQPRAISYVRKASRLRAEQIRPWDSCRDLLWLEVNNTTIINIYKQPASPRNQATRLLLDLQLPPQSLVAGDFNSWYRLWEPEVRQTRNDGQEIAAWASDQQLDYIVEAGVPTQDGGHTIDLAFSNIPHATARVMIDYIQGGIMRAS